MNPAVVRLMKTLLEGGLVLKRLGAGVLVLKRRPSGALVLKRLLAGLLVLAATSSGLSLAERLRAPRNQEGTAHFSRFGTVSFYQGSPRPSHVVLFVSGDGGWNLGVVDMARELAGLDALVVGIDIRTYLKNLESASEKCSYPAADFEALSQFIQKKLDFPRYIVPVLSGYSSGATLVYAVLVQAPAGTFRGAISLGFCPDLPLVKPFCRGSGLAWKPGPRGKGVSFEPSGDLESPWVALQGTVDQVCDPSATRTFVEKVHEGRIVLVPKVGHGFSVPRNWMPQFREAFSRLMSADGRPSPEDRSGRESGSVAGEGGRAGGGDDRRVAGAGAGERGPRAQSDGELADPQGEPRPSALNPRAQSDIEHAPARGALEQSEPSPRALSGGETAPARAVPGPSAADRRATDAATDLSDLPLVEVPAGKPAGEVFAVIVSGDGGWAGLDRELGGSLASRGVPVVGLNSLQYFWTRRTPEGAASDLARILRQRLSDGHSQKVILIGYSRGADVLPFMANRLPPELLAHVSLVALLGPAHSVDFRFHLSDWLGGSHPGTALPVLPEVKKLKGVNLVCFYGEDESDTLCPELDPAAGKAIRLSGGHHFGHDYAAIAQRLLAETAAR